MISAAPPRRAKEPAKPPPPRPNAAQGIFPPERSALDRKRDRRRPADRLRRRRGHDRRPLQGLVRHRRARRRCRRDKDKNTPKPEASMFYTAYFKQGVPVGEPADHLPVQRGARVIDGVVAHGRVRAGPRRRRPTGGTRRAPYSVINNDQSLLDASDLVFIDAPGTGFSRIAGKDKEKSLLRGRPGYRRLRTVHLPIPVAI